MTDSVSSETVTVDSLAAVNRPSYSGNAAQNRLLAVAIEATRNADEAQKRADWAAEHGWQAILAAREAGVPDEVICERTGWSRATLNRKFGPRTKRADK